MVASTLFVIYKAGHEPTPYNMLLNLHMSLYNIILWPIKSSQFDNWFVNNRDFQGSNRRVWRYQRVNQNLYIEEEQTTQWPKEKGQITIYKHTYKIKDRVTRTPLKTGDELRCSGRVSSSCSTSDTCRVNLVTNPVITLHEVQYDQKFTTNTITIITLYYMSICICK